MVEQIVVGLIDTNCYIYYTDKKKAVIIDPGGNETDILERVAHLGLTIIGIGLTHGHFDHIAAIGTIRDYFRKDGTILKIAIHASDKNYLGKSGEMIGHEVTASFGLGQAYGQYFHNLPDPDVLLSEGQTLFDTDLEVIETAGHTMGSVCFYSPREKVLFAGDTLFYRGIGRTDFPDSDSEKIIENIKSKLFALPPDTIVHPGHGPRTTIGRERDNFSY